MYDGRKPGTRNKREKYVKLCETRSRSRLARLHRNSRLAASRGARDRTKYGLSRASPRSYLTHHIQRIAFAAVRANAKHARWMISCYKTSVCAGA